MFDKFVQETDSSEKLKLMRGLTGTRESWLLNKLVNFLYKFPNKQYLCYSQRQRKRQREKIFDTLFLCFFYRFITIAKNENYVRAQDFFSCLTAISNNPVGTPLVWDWVRGNWEFLVQRYTLNDRYLGQLIPGITKTFATETKLNEMKAFFEKYPEAGAGASNRAKALETVQNNIKWLTRNTAKLENWLNSHSSN